MSMIRFFLGFFGFFSFKAYFILSVRFFEPHLLSKTEKALLYLPILMYIIDLLRRLSRKNCEKGRLPVFRGQQKGIGSFADLHKAELHQTKIDACTFPAKMILCILWLFLPGNLAGKQFFTQGDHILEDALAQGTKGF